MPAWNRIALTLSVLVASAGPLPACGQSIPLPGARTGTPATAPAAAAAPAESAEDIRKLLAAAHTRLEAIEAQGEAPSDAPPGTPLTEVLERLSMARLLASTYEKQLNALDAAEAARQRLADAQRADESWRGFADPPPYSILLVDGLRDELEAARTALTGAEATAALFERLEAKYTPRVKASQSMARLAVEAADRARGTQAFAVRDWERNLAVLRATLDGSTQVLLQLGLRGAQAEVAAATAARELANRKLAAVGLDFHLPQADLEKVLAEIEARKRATERELERATRAAAAATEAVSKAELRLANADAGPKAGAGAGRTEVLARELERELAVVREVAVTANQRAFLLREQILRLEGERGAWESRAEAINQRDPVRARASYDRLTESLAALRATRQYLEQRHAAVESRLRDEEAKQRGAAGSEDPVPSRLLQTLRQRQEDLRASLDSGLPLQRLVLRFRTDFENRRDVSTMARVKDAFASGLLAARQVWHFELFAIDDTLETPDGRKMTVSRSVTVGKTFGAVLIVLVGYWLSSFVLRRVERRVVATGRTSLQAAALSRKWILFVVTAILTMFALVSAGIPLTAFAFLGGALAIAAGFGLQNLLKNLVSGVMLLVEKPLRLGDLIEVDGIRGRVTEIGIRASTIRSVDGIESMIPNSRFIEGNVTNWTYSNAQTRHSISVGVAYGSPLRKVADILAGVLDGHTRVLKNPAPQVYLEEFADSAISFSLTYWVELTAEIDSRRTKSDLLLSIDRAFEEAGISIPFPQRDVHFSSEGPVPVAIVNQAPGGAG